MQQLLFHPNKACSGSCCILSCTLHYIRFVFYSIGGALGFVLSNYFLCQTVNTRSALFSTAIQDRLGPLLDLVAHRVGLRFQQEDGAETHATFNSCLHVVGVTRRLGKLAVRIPSNATSDPKERL